MDYRIEIYDTWGRRIATYDEVPLLEAVRSVPGQPDQVRGILPGKVSDLSHGYRLRVLLGGEVFCEAYVTAVRPQWSDTRKLVLERYVAFHEVFEFEAEWPALDLNTSVSRGYANRSVSSIVKSVINSALGPIHYRVAHQGYPDGAQREYAKFLQRKSAENELEIGGISAGQWVGSTRINASGAFAKDGDTIAGLVVDGGAWPDLRLMMIDSEETSLNPHTHVRHPETATWTEEQYAASGYKLKADAARQALQELIDTKGIEYIELNPHRDSSGAFDDRVDAYGRYVGLVFAGGECFNAAQVECGHADVYQYDKGKYHVPEMELKDFFSYTGVNEDSVEDSAETLEGLDVTGGALEVLAALAYFANGFVWTVEPDYAVRFYRAERPDRVVFFDAVRTGIGLGSDSGPIANILYFQGNPVTSVLSKTFRRSASIEAYDERIRRLDYFSISIEQDADKLALGILNDLAYPEPCGFIQFFQGNVNVRLGDIVEVRDGPLCRLERTVSGEWDDRFAGKLVGRVRRVLHRFTGKHVSTTVWLTSPFRSVSEPLSFIVRSQGSAASLYQFRLDEATVGLDMGYHLD